MEYGNAAWGLRELPLEEQLKLTQAMGLHLLELSIANYHRDVLQPDASAEQIRQVKALFAQYDVRPDCGATGNDFTAGSAADVRESLDRVKRAADIAAALGVPEGTIRSWKGRLHVRQPRLRRTVRPRA